MYLYFFVYLFVLLDDCDFISENCAHLMMFTYQIKNTFFTQRIGKLLPIRVMTPSTFF